MVFNFRISFWYKPINNRLMEIQNESQTKKNMAALIIINIIFGLALIPACVMAMFAPMIFDAPGSQNSSLTWFLFYAILSFPVLIVISIVATWIFYFTRHYKLAFWISLMPLLSVGWMVLAFALLQTLQGGNFRGR